MIIGVISDTHRVKSAIERAVYVMKKAEVEIIFHLGDNVEDAKDIERLMNKEVISVKGNCDTTNSVPSEIVIEAGGKKFLLTHGHNHNVYRDLNILKYKGIELGVDMVLFGHTHVPAIEFQDELYFMNPGSAASSRLRGNTIGLITIINERIIPEIINL